MKDFLLRYKSWGKEGKAGFLISPAFLWLLLFFLIPLGIIFVYSFCERGNYGGVNWNFTFENYKQVLNPVYLKTILYSFWIAILNTVICLLIGYPMAYYISTRKSTVFKNILLILVILPFWTDFLVRTYAWLVILREGGLINTILLQMGIIQEPLKLLFTDLAVIIGLVYGYLPFMILPLYASIEKLDPSLIEAAYDLGANGFNVFWKVILPLTSPGIIAGSILVFVPTLGAYITPDLLGGAKVMMIGNLIQQQFLKVKNWPFGSSLSFIVLIIVLALLIIYIKFGEPEVEK
ncbi:MAG: Spermidine/putrescine transport system permease protein PotB [bacterium ADurb.Bin363]|nr:MAG: Spermidine/putrescine transport system permease protein PotB [bacterium ADurb.Bin363]